MKKWTDEEGTEFRNSDDLCYGKEFKPDTDKVDIAKITIKGEYPEGGKWGYLEESHEMAMVIRGEGFIMTKKGERHDLKQGDVVHVEPGERFRWGGDMDMIVPCGPAFDPKKHRIVGAEE